MNWKNKRVTFRRIFVKFKDSRVSHITAHVFEVSHSDYCRTVPWPPMVDGTIARVIFLIMNHMDKLLPWTFRVFQNRFP